MQGYHVVQFECITAAIEGSLTNSAGPRTKLAVDPCNSFGVWSLFLPREQIQIISENTNKNGRNPLPIDPEDIDPARYNGQWVDTAVEDIYGYIAILVYMDECRFPGIEYCWGDDMGRHYCVRNTMSCDRWKQIHQKFYLADPDLEKVFANDLV